MLYAISALHCMTVSLAHDGAGLGTVWGEELAQTMLADAGFVDVVVHDVPDDPSTSRTSRSESWHRGQRDEGELDDRERARRAVRFWAFGATHSAMEYPYPLAGPGRGLVAGRSPAGTSTDHAD
jgi:hypothetical protein